MSKNLGTVGRENGKLPFNRKKAIYRTYLMGEGKEILPTVCSNLSKTFG